MRVTSVGEKETFSSVSSTTFSFTYELFLLNNVTSSLSLFFCIRQRTAPIVDNDFHTDIVLCECG